MKDASLPVLIFDMDGVLIDSEPIHMEIERQIFQALGINVTVEEHESMVGMSPKNTWNWLKNKYGLKQSIPELFQLEQEKKYEALQKRELAPTQGLTTLLSNLKQQGFRLAVASSSNKIIIDLILSKLQIHTYFDFIISGEEVTNSKPAPDIFLRVAAFFKQPATACIVIEDSHNGLKAAQAAGMKCIGYVNPHSGRQDLSSANVVIDNFSELTIPRILALNRS